MNQRPLVPSENRFQRLLHSVREFSPRRLIEKETWVRLVRWIVWRVSPKRRRILYLARHLTPLDSDTPPEVQAIRDEVFALTCLKLKKVEMQRTLLEILNAANKPSGFEQVFVCSIYPSILKRNLVITSVETTTDHRMDVEIGYLGHNEDYFFWVFQIDGRTKSSVDRTLSPRQEPRDDKLYLIYQLDVIALFDDNLLDALQWISNSQVHFDRILTDLKKRNYKVTAAAIPHFEWGRLSLLRRLSLDALRKRRSPSAHRTR